MSPSKSRLRRATLTSTVAAGIALLGMSVNGMAAMSADLEQAAKRSAPLRLEEERDPRVSECPGKPPAESATTEI